MKMIDLNRRRPKPTYFQEELSLELSSDKKENVLNLLSWPIQF